eukprot:Selendium_serpulae@DN4055_c0_g1_i1.p1
MTHTPRRNSALAAVASRRAMPRNVVRRLQRRLPLPVHRHCLSGRGPRALLLGLACLALTVAFANAREQNRAFSATEERDVRRLSADAVAASPDRQAVLSASVKSHPSFGQMQVKAGYSPSAYSSSSSSATSDGYYKMGCFKDVTTDHDLPLEGPMDAAMTLEMCSSFCFESKMLYFGVAAGNMCRCGNWYGKHGYTGEEQPCETGCAGKSEQNCGGLSVEVQAIYPVNSGNMIVCRGATDDLVCPLGWIAHISRVFYGKEADHCGTGTESETCGSSSELLDLVQPHCEAKGRCTLTTDLVQSVSCGGGDTVYLEVEYICSQSPNGIYSSSSDDQYNQYTWTELPSYQTTAPVEESSWVFWVCIVGLALLALGGMYFFFNSQSEPEEQQPFHGGYHY